MKPDPTKDGPEVDLILFFKKFPEGATYLEALLADYELDSEHTVSVPTKPKANR